MLESGKLTVGLNYWSSDSATRMWRNWDRNVVERDLALCERYGIAMLRVFPLWSDFQPLNLLCYGGSARGCTPREVTLGEEERPLPDTAAGQAGLDEVMLVRFREFCDIAAGHNLKLIVALMTVHMTGRHFVPRAMENRDLFSDPFALKWEMKFYDGFVRAMKDHDAIAAWETGNEMNYTAPVKNADHAWVWTRMMHDVIRLADPSRPVVGVMAEGLNPMESPWQIADQGELADFTNVHRYDIGNAAAADGFLSVRNLLRAAGEARIAAGVGGKPCFIEETGNWRNTVLTLEDMGHAVEALLWNAWREDCRAFLWWCAFDQAHLEFAPYHWGDWPGLEHGIFTADGQAHPAARAMRDFGRMLAELPFDRLPAPTPDALCVIDDMDVGGTAFLLARQAGIHLAFHSARRGPLPEAKVYFLPSVAARGGLDSENWRKLRERVRSGATCYLSCDDCNLPDLAEFCGMEIGRRRKALEPMRCTLGGAALSLACPVEKSVRCTGAEVLLRDERGEALLLRHRYGQGTVFTLNFALEKILTQTPRACTEPWRQIYRMILPKTLPAFCDDPEVIVSCHHLPDGRVAAVAVNCSDQPRQAALQIDAARQVTGLYPASRRGADGAIILPPGGGAVLMLEARP